MVDRRKAQGGQRQPVLTESWFDPLGDHISAPDVSSAVVLTPPQAAGRVLLQTNTQNIRYTLDGTTPTAASGFVLTAGDPPIMIHLRPTVTITIIEVAASADVEIQYCE